MDDGEPYAPLPTVVPVLAGISVTQLASGWDHNLLVTNVGEVRVRGCGRACVCARARVCMCACE